MQASHSSGCAVAVVGGDRTQTLRAGKIHLLSRQSLGKVRSETGVQTKWTTQGPWAEESGD